MAEERIVEQRKEKIERLKELGYEPYAYKYEVTTTAKELLDKFGRHKEGEDKEKEQLPEEEFSLAGRIVSMRVMGKAAFFHIQDGTEKIQCYVRRDLVGEEFYNKIFKKLIDIGDIVGVKGKLFRTRTGELTLETFQITLLTKSLRPLPEKWHGLTDVEKRYRQRYLDLIVNPQVREIFRTRTKIIKKLREFLDSKGFMEVETPILQPIASGAAAKPFITHYNALDIDVYLRIAPELYLKRLLVGGFERVYELGKNFRNEGISTRHNPEFTMVEFYMAYADYNDLMELTEELFEYLLDEIFGKGAREIEYQGTKLSFKRPFRRISYLEELSKKTSLTEDELLHDEEKVLEKAKEVGVENAEKLSHFKRVQELFEALIEPELIQPTFVIDFPKAISPLAKEKRGNPELVERFELFIFGREIANAYTELNNPEEQEARFRQQLEEKAKGDDEAMEYDADFITALEYGMPPTAGEGIGIDRLVMLFTDKDSIREVLLFPQLRPEKKHHVEETKDSN
ncbi:Lysyl-tRNA synthetase [Desulfurobacterium thermolithotrophum DSM 11699]|uniref:Lysine--tRNA ligase n=1 Tax=Desulfurobacterium thermolithotrophum (strain DSM 11699 / BSA) TaxID=868864 RepID=F0S3M7_DESTD|nr:lysine--tRNA ligase [Desulfurobacterium thermolithotrophum]ADY73449.1 Lysyl-tRNA synthetase [Desulfurobacterium thermolithotrophum DSM 11699]